MEIVINEQKIPLRFSYGLIRAMSKRWGINNVEAVLNKIMTVFAAAEEDFFGAIDTVTEIVVEAAKIAGNEVDAEDVADMLFADMTGVMIEVIRNFVESIPQVTPDDVEELKKKMLSPRK